MTLEEIISKEEKQVFDRKSADIDAKALAITIVAFANADGGDIAIGISDKTRRIDGTDYIYRHPGDGTENIINRKNEKTSLIKDRKAHV